MYSKGYKVEFDEDGDALEESEVYELSENQAQFCNDVEDSGEEIDWLYSGRGMYGKYCPAARVSAPNDIATKAKVMTDSMGRGVVVYARY